MVWIALGIAGLVFAVVAFAEQLFLFRWFYVACVADVLEPNRAAFNSKFSATTWGNMVLLFIVVFLSVISILHGLS